jgi:hypothetical protein
MSSPLERTREKTGAEERESEYRVFLFSFFYPAVPLSFLFFFLPFMFRGLM